MKPFETIGSDGRTYLHYENWERWRHERLSEYPCPQEQYRFDIELITPRDRLEDVPVERNPHSHGHSAHHCFYDCDDWSTIWGVHDAHKHDVDGPSFRMLVESGCLEPIWGERIRLFSTSSCIENEPWGMNIPNKFAYFRGQYWRIIMWQFLHPYQTGLGYPLVNRRMPLWNMVDYFALLQRIAPIITSRYPIRYLVRHDIDWRKEGF